MTETLTKVGVGLGFLVAVVSSLMLQPPVPDLPPCPTEDSSNCYWDATVQGDGNGMSFIDIDGTAYYTDGTILEPSQ